MREILFRGKRKEDDEWVYGFLVSQKHIGDWVTAYPVVPNTVGQFTGLTDKRGKKIFEGDIIKSDNGKQSAISIVKFGEYYPEMFYKMLDMCCPGKRHLLANGFYAQSIDKHEEMILFQSPCCEIIGNIHDNPELLGGDYNA